MEKAGGRLEGEVHDDFLTIMFVRERFYWLFLKFCQNSWMSVVLYYNQKMKQMSKAELRSEKGWKKSWSAAVSYFLLVWGRSRMTTWCDWHDGHVECVLSVLQCACVFYVFVYVAYRWLSNWEDKRKRLLDSVVSRPRGVLAECERGVRLCKFAKGWQCLVLFFLHSCANSVRSCSVSKSKKFLSHKKFLLSLPVVAALGAKEGRNRKENRIGHIYHFEYCKKK